MIPAQFDYVRAGSVDEAVAALAAGGDDAKVLAGGQSLIPLLRLRLSYPDVVVDVGRVEEMRGVRDDGDHLVIGAMTTHHDVIRDPLVKEHAGLIAEATATVADPAVRHRGTFGGALSHADPAGDLPAVALALDAELVIAGSGGRRTVPASEFFVDYLQTAVEPDEVLVEVRVPKLDRLGLPVREVPPGRAVVGHRRCRRRRPPRQRRDRRGQGRPDEHGCDAGPGDGGRAGAGGGRAGRDRRGRRAGGGGHQPALATSTARPTTASTSPGS